MANAGGWVVEQLLGKEGIDWANNAGASALSFVHDPRLEQENICKDTVKSLVLCANDKDYVPGTDSWQANSQCVTGAQATTFSQCKGASIRYENSVATNVPAAMGYPAYVAVGVRERATEHRGVLIHAYTLGGPLTYPIHTWPTHHRQ